jgi:hypothetical protein
MKWLKILSITIGSILVITASIVCATSEQIPNRAQSSANSQASVEESVELQSRGNGIAELVTNQVHDGTYAAKLIIPDNYSFGDAARIAVHLDSIVLRDITSLSFWCYIDTATPINPDGSYWIPYLTFELDTDGKPGCDTWVIGGGGTVSQPSGVWFENTMENGWLYHVSSNFSNYTNPFPLSNMGTLTQIKEVIGPDGKTSLGDCVVTKVRLAIGNWGSGGPLSPVICYVDCLVQNGELVF